MTAPEYTLTELAYMATQVTPASYRGVIPGFLPSRLVNVLGRGVLDLQEVLERIARECDATFENDDVDETSTYAYETLVRIKREAASALVSGEVAD